MSVSSLCKYVGRLARESFVAPKNNVTHYLNVFKSSACLEVSVMVRAARLSKISLPFSSVRGRGKRVLSRLPIS